MICVPQKSQSCSCVLSLHSIHFKSQPVKIFNYLTTSSLSITFNARSLSISKSITGTFDKILLKDNPLLLLVERLLLLVSLHFSLNVGFRLSKSKLLLIPFILVFLLTSCSRFCSSIVKFVECLFVFSMVATTEDFMAGLALLTSLPDLTLMARR